MKFNSQICTTKEQSERLLALGLKKETADMTLFKSPNLPQYPFDYTFNHDTSILADVRYVPMVKGETPFIQDGNVPAWSLHRLLCLLPTEYIGDIDFQQVMQDFVFRSQDMYDEVISCIETLIKEGYFNKEYLEERV